MSPGQDEQKFTLLMTAADYMLNRCEETVQHTRRTLFCWLQSTKPHTCYPKPLALVALDSQEEVLAALEDNVKEALVGRCLCVGLVWIGSYDP
jgi:hypothetical protein